MRELSITDDRGVSLYFQAEPQRIVSLVPSDTYSLARLGLIGQLVARTEYCVYPASVTHLPIIGGTKNADVAQIVALMPDLVVANQEENRKRDIELLEEAGVNVYVSFPKTCAAGLRHIERLAELFPSLTAEACDTLNAARNTLEHFSARKPALKPCFVPIWMDPLMTVNGDTFISDVLELCGGRNVFSDRQRRYPLAADLGRREALGAAAIAGRDVRYPRITSAELVERKPALVLLPDEPHPFGEEDADFFRGLDLPAAETGAIHLCDGKALMWYGLRSIEGLAGLADLVKAQ